MRLDFLRPAPQLAWRQIHWPSDLPPELALGLLRQLATDRFIRFLVFELEVSTDGIVYRVGVPALAVGRIEQLVPTLIPDSALTVATRRPGRSDAWRVALKSHHRPLRITNPEQVARGILAALASVKKNEMIVVQWLLGPRQAPRPVAAEQPASTVEPWWRPLIGGDERLDADRRHALQSKRSDHAFGCVARVSISAKGDNRTRALAVSVQAGLRVAEAPGVGLRLFKEDGRRFDRVVLPWRWPYVLNIAELVGLLGWPLGDQSFPGIDRGASRWLRPDPRIHPARRVLGRATAPGDHRELGLSIQDARHHLHVLGPTGTGKSTLLANLITQDISAGRSVVVIEPKGDLVEAVLTHVPPERIDDVVLIDPAEMEHPVGLNPLNGRGRRPEVIADRVLATFHGVSEGWGPRLQDILHASLLTLAGRSDATLCLLPALLTNPGVRRRLLAGVDDPIALGPFWNWYESISDAERQQAIAPVLNRLRPFLLRRSVRTIVGQVQPKFRIDAVFTKRKIVLVSLAKGLIGPEAAALLGSLFVAELWQAVLARAAVPAEQRHPVVVYADEFQDYVHLPTDMADALAQARGLGVGLTLAHQHLAQLPANLRAAVLANARSRVCFQLSAEDAQMMARLAGDLLKPSDFQRLHRYEAYAQLVVGGEVTDFASIKTLPPSPQISDPRAVREASQRLYGRPADEVEAEIRKLVEGEPPGDERLWKRGRSQQ